MHSTAPVLNFIHFFFRRNVGWASTCNTVGQSTGYFISNALFLALESSSFCNAHLRSVPNSNGIWNLKGFELIDFFHLTRFIDFLKNFNLLFAGFLQTWAIIYVIVTILVLLLKREKKPQIAVSNVYKSYSQLCKILTHPPVKQIVFLHLTSKVGYAATEVLTNLRLIDAGVPRHNLALMSMPMVPINIILPLALSKLVAGPRPFTVFLKSLPPRLLRLISKSPVVINQLNSIVYQVIDVSRTRWSRLLGKNIEHFRRGISYKVLRCSLHRASVVSNNGICLHCWYHWLSL